MLVATHKQLKGSSMFLDLITPALTYKMVLLAAMVGSFLCKLFFLGICIRFLLKTDHYRAPLLFLIVFLTGNLIGECGEITGLLLRKIVQLEGNVPVYSFLSRMGWVFILSQYHALALFLELLATKKIRFGVLQIASIAANIAISGCFLFMAIFYYHVPSASLTTLPFELQLIQMVRIITPLLFIQPAFIVFKKLKSGELPQILDQQLKIALAYIIPFVLLGIFNSKYSYISLRFPTIIQDGYLIYTITSLISTCLLYILGKKMLGLRFLNLRSDVASKVTFNLLSRCADILENLRYATAVKELAHLTQTFFQSAFDVPLGRTRLYLRNGAQDVDTQKNTALHDPLNIYAQVEKQLSDTPELLQALSSSKLFIRDEIHFSYYYNGDEQSARILSFLDAINAAIFLPIYERSTIIAYIVIERDARPKKLFTNKERDEMLVFTTYISNIMIMLSNRTVEELLYERKQLADELFHKHQEVNQYKESIRSFLRAHRDRKMGIVFYKNRRFTIANEAGQDLIGFDLNTQEGHPLVIALRSVARRVEDYKTAQFAFSHDAAGNKIVISGLVSPEHAVILLVHYPEIADLIKDQFTNLQDPSKWDYVLYLETTQAGKIVDALLPGRGEKVLAFKINLLAAALSKKAALLLMPEEDLRTSVEILHTISMRETLHIMNLSSRETHNELALELFGLNPLMGETPIPLLEKLDAGTLFIEHIENLSLATQDLLAHFLAVGSFEKLKSTTTISSNVRILCSSNHDLKALVKEGLFSQALYDELHETTITMPALYNLSEIEIDEIARGCAEQLIPSQTYQHVLTLTAKETAHLCADRPTSIAEFKTRVHDLLHEKSDKLSLTEVTTFDVAYNEPNPAIAQAVRLGKKALKDPQVMALLWNKFKNQNKIAQVLGVNRSSVNRRIHEYGLI